MTDGTEGKTKLWGGRFKGGLDPVMAVFNSCIDSDVLLWEQDLTGSIAWARANSKVGILTEEEFATMHRGLLAVADEWRSGTFQLRESDEDIHTANERRLGEIIGKDIAGKLHTGRSRNEQSPANQRLWLKARLGDMEAILKTLASALADRAERDIELVMPGYTHLQRAQPVRWSHWLMSYAFSISKDIDRIREVARRVDESPYGCGAIAGNAFGVDRHAIARELGFASIKHNSMEATGDRSYTIEALQTAVSIMLHLSRLSEDLILYGTSEFRFVQLSDAYSTGSSLMPQKKNADSLELIRGKSGEVIGLMTGVLVSIKGLPSTYNKDLQGSFASLASALSITENSARIMTGVINTLTTNAGAMRAALSPDMLATDVADYLVRKGVPFRETHHIAGQVVALAEDTGVPMDKLSVAQLRGVDARFGDDIVDVFDYEKSVESRSVEGGTSRTSVMRQIEILRGGLSQ